jgi:hypothetical protein
MGNLVSPPSQFLSACLNMNQWASVRGNTHYLGVVEWALSPDRVDDGTLAQCLGNMNAHGIKLILEVGVVKGGCQGYGCYLNQITNLRRIQTLGGGNIIGAFQMDEPLGGPTGGRDQNYPDLHTANHTCDYIAHMRPEFPNAKIINIEPYPRIPASQFQGWIATLQSSCQVRNTQPPDMLTIDHDWGAGGSLTDVRGIRDVAHSMGQEFGLIFWPSTTNSLDNAYWHTRTQQYASAVAAHGINPEMYVVESWLNIPTITVTEEYEYSFTWSVKQLISQGLLPGTISPPPAGTVTAYEHLDFTGASLSVPSDMQFVGWDWNDRVTSIRVPAGRTVTLYEHSDFGGQSLTLTSDSGDLRNYSGPGADGTWNDAVSSIRVQ